MVWDNMKITFQRTKHNYFQKKQVTKLIQRSLQRPCWDMAREKTPPLRAEKLTEQGCATLLRIKIWKDLPEVSQTVMGLTSSPVCSQFKVAQLFIAPLLSLSIAPEVLSSHEMGCTKTIQQKNYKETKLLKLTKLNLSFIPEIFQLRTHLSHSLQLRTHLKQSPQSQAQEAEHQDPCLASIWAQIEQKNNQKLKKKNLC